MKVRPKNTQFIQDSVTMPYTGADGGSAAITRVSQDDNGDFVLHAPYTLPEVTVSAPDLRVAKAARQRPGYEGLQKFALGTAVAPAALMAVESGAAAQAARKIAGLGKLLWRNRSSDTARDLGWSMIGGEGVNTASTLATGNGYEENLRNTIGYQPDNPYLRALYEAVTDMANPGYAVSGAGVNAVKNAGKAVINGVKNVRNFAENFRLSVPSDPNRYYRIVGKTGNPIGDATESGVIRGPGANPAMKIPDVGDGVVDLSDVLIKAHDYPMFGKGRPWTGSTARTAQDLRKKPYIIRSKSDTGPIVWEQSNIDFRHKGHDGIFRPSYYGDVNASPTQYFEYWEPKKIGYLRHDFPIAQSVEKTPIKPWSINDVNGIENASIRQLGDFTKYTLGNDTYMIDKAGNIASYRPNSLSDSFGELMLVKDMGTNNYKVKMTSPYADATVGVKKPDETVKQALSKTISKDEVKSFSSNIQKMIPNGSRLSADYEGGINRPGLSMDSFQWLTSQPKHGRGRLTFDTENLFHAWNNQTVKNGGLYNLYKRYVNNPNSENLKVYKSALDDWLLKQGMPVSTIENGNVLIAQPWIQYSKGGRLYRKGEKAF